MTTGPAERARNVHRASGADDAHALGEELFHPHRLTPLGASRAFLMAATSADVGPLTIGTLRYSGPVHVDTAPYVTSYQVNVPLTGTFRTTVGEHRVDATPARAAVYRPDVDTAFSGWDRPCVMLAIKLERATVERLARSVLGIEVDEVLPVDPALDVSTGPGRAWLESMRRLAETERKSGPLDAALTAHLAEQGIVRLLGATALGRRAEALAVPAPEAAIDRARDAIAHATGDPLTLDALATLSGVTGRALQLAFRRDHGETPMRYQRRVRLDRVRAELLGAAPDDVRVAEVAARHGFAHLGRFAGQYAQQHGERPSETLARRIARS